MLIDRYMASANFAALGAETRRGYRRSLARMRALFGELRPEEWRPAWGQHYADQLSSRPMAANADLQVLSVIFALAVRSGLLRANPVRDVRRWPRKARQRYVSDAEVGAFLAHAGQRLGAYVALKLATGIRQAQLVALRWSDWNGTVLSVPAAKGGRDTNYTGPGVAAAIEVCAATFKRGDDSGVSGAIVTTQDGRPYASAASFRSTVWQRAMGRYVAAGGTKFTEHDLRAKVATDVQSIDWAQALLGHRQAAVTQRHYIRGPRFVESVQRDLFDHMGGPAASLPEKSAGNRRSAERTRSPLRRGCPAGPPASQNAAAATHSQTSNPAAAASVQSPAPPGRAARKPKATRGDSEAGTPPSGGRTARAAP